MLLKSPGLTVSDWSVLPFIDEMPVCRYAVPADEPNALVTWACNPSAALVVEADMFPPPKSNGMIVKMSTAPPDAAAFLISCWPHQFGPLVVVPNVTIVFTPEFFPLTIFNASMTFCWVASLSISVDSMSMSIALNLNALITVWYAPASAAALPQNSPSLLPAQPPIDGSTSPPAERIAEMVLPSTPPVSGRWPSQAGAQLPLERMNAIVNHLMPVADITVCGLGGSPPPPYR